MTHDPVQDRARPVRRRSPMEEKLGWFGPIYYWMSKNLFSSFWNSVVSLICIFILYKIVPFIVDWALLSSMWFAETGEDCREATGACWAVIPVKYRVMFFGVYPYEEHWRPVLAIGLYALAVAITCTRRFWRLKLLLVVWAITLAIFLMLMWGGIFGLEFVPTTQWGGLPLTFLIFSSSMFLGMPIAIALALGRQSKMPVIRILSVFTIELTRTIPLPMILFFAAIILPLFLPQGMEIDQLLRVALGIAFYFGCFQAEVLRGGFQAVPKGQYEAADAIGLPYWKKTFKIILPQVFRITIPSVMNGVIAGFKDTTMVIIVGLFDLLTATQAVVSDPEWRRYFTEAYLFVALVYFVFTFAMSKYSQHLERLFSFGRR